MSGFPNRPSRQNFGPTLEDERPVQNPKRELGAAGMNLDFWQVAGMGLTAPRAAIGVDAAGTPVNANFFQGLSWDPLQTLPDIVVTNSGTGIYQAVFQATYADQDETLVATSLKAGLAFPMGSGNLNGIVSLPDAQTANIRIFTANTGAAVDSNFFLLLW